MADPARAYAFDALAASMQAVPLAAPGVTITPRHPTVMFDLRGDARDADFVRDASNIFHVTLPLVPNTTSKTNDARVLWLGPDEWLIVCDNRGYTTSSCNEPENKENVVAPGFSVIDVTHGRAVLRIAGSDACRALARICSLDLDPRQFPVGACAQTTIAKINVIIDHIGPDAFDLYCPRSYARSFWHAITQAVAQYGCKIEPS